MIIDIKISFIFKNTKINEKTDDKISPHSGV